MRRTGFPLNLQTQDAYNSLIQKDKLIRSPGGRTGEVCLGTEQCRARPPEGDPRNLVEFQQIALLARSVQVSFPEHAERR